jgi:hypothetical protein
MSRRHDLLLKLEEIFKENLNGVDYVSNLYGNVHHEIDFWDEVEQYPYVGLNLGTEIRDYEPAGVKWAFVELSIRVYVHEETPNDSLNQLLEDIEDIIDRNNNIEYQENVTTTEIRVNSIITDEGIMAPLGVGEVKAQIRYELPICCYN